MKQALVLNERDEKRVLTHISRSIYSRRHRAMFQPTWLAGMRVGEIAALKVSDVVDADGGVRAQVHVSAGTVKGREATTDLLNAQAQAEMMLYFELFLRRLE